MRNRERKKQGEEDSLHAWRQHSSHANISENKKY